MKLWRALHFMSHYWPEARRTLALAGPIIVGQVSQMLMAVTDSVMIGRLGAVELAAAAFANAVWAVAFMAGIGLLVPVAVLVSRAHGGGRNEEAGDWLRHGTALALIAGGLATAGLLALTLGLDRFGQPVEVIAAVRPYFELIAVSMVPTLVFQAWRQFGESLGRPWEPMAIMLASVALNVVLNWILIYGHWGAPALGLEGAGWATLVSRWVSVGVIFAWLRQAPALRAAWPAGWFSGYRWARFREMLAFGIPAAGGLVFEAGAFAAAAVMMGWIGATELAAHQIAISCAAFTFMFPLGLSMAVGMRIGRAVGEGRGDKLRVIGIGAQGMSALTMGTFAVVFAVAGPRLAAGFVTEPDVIALAAQLLVVAAIFQLADGGQVVAVGALRGLADVRVPTVLTFVAYWGLALPGAYFFGVKGPGGPLGVWAALAVGLAFAAVALNWRFARLTRIGALHDAPHR